MVWIGPPFGPVCSATTRSPYFFGASFDISHLRVSTFSRERWTSSSFSSAMSTISSAQATVLSCCARRYCSEKVLCLASHRNTVETAGMSSALQMARIDLPSAISAQMRAAISSL